MVIRNKRELTEQAQEKIDALVNDLIDTIDVDLLSNAEKIVYLKTIIGHSVPRKESVSINKLKAPDGVKWLLDQSETKIQGLINDRVGRYIADTNVVDDTRS
jgi:hypothetical protein